MWCLAPLVAFSGQRVPATREVFLRGIERVCLRTDGQAIAAVTPCPHAWSGLKVLRELSANVTESTTSAQRR